MKHYFIIKLSIFFLTLSFTSCIISSYNDSCSISGKITDSNGKGISDVKIITKSISTNDSVKSQIDGSYNVSIANGGVVDVFISKSEFTSKKFNITLLGGENKTLNTQLNTLSEDSYFELGFKEKTVFNIGEIFAAEINTNVTYEFESKASWITCTKDGTQLLIKCDSNETSEIRHGIVILRANYNHIDTIKISQLAGPILRVTDFYSVSKPNFSQTVPFVTFSREIVAVSAKESNLNIPFELSSDKKTIFFSSLKLNAFSSNIIQINVVDSDGNNIYYNLDLSLYINYQSLPVNNGQKIFFTNNNQEVWVYTLTGQTHTLRRFSCIDFKELKPITLSESSNVFYNPYNNSIYSVAYRFIENRYVTDVSIYNAETSLFSRSFTIDSNNNTISAMEFADSGYGLMVLGTQLFYIDSANNHSWGLFSKNSLLYDPSQTDWLLTRNIEKCDNNKTFVLYGGDSSGKMHVFTISSVTKALTPIYSSFSYHFTTTNNSGTNAIYYSDYTNSLIFQNTFDHSTKTVALSSKGVRYAALLLSDKSTPHIFTSNFSIISVNDNVTHNFTHTGTCDGITSSNDGKLILVKNNGIAYLFKSEIFTKHPDLIK
ncbi:MAG: carboxypeptidase regulatory-like domain-containing protein [Bacteroidales bacterium]|nr:carboxypeptidase regulatory-like domain-containing protein [Bacteroidales bacterium]